VLNAALAAQPLFDGRSSETKNIPFRVFSANGHARWLLEANQTRPWHLRIWPTTTLKAKVYTGAAWLVARFGVLPPSAAADFPCNADSNYASIRKDFDRVGVFLGTPGPNRKIVVFAGNDDSSVFIKIPTSASSAALVDNEARALAELSADPQLAALVPRPSLVGGQLAVEDQVSRGARYGVLPVQRLISVDQALFARSRTVRSFEDIWKSWQSGGGSASPETTERNDTARTLLDANTSSLQRLHRSFDAQSLVECYLAHGDFTRWNVLTTAAGEPRILDWEMYGLRPRFFDLCHYFVSADILIARRPSAEILSRLFKLGRSLAAASLCTEKEWKRAVTLYFGYQSCFYNDVFRRQGILHPQALWQLATWNQALDSLV